jgi:hypothetical protein
MREIQAEARKRNPRTNRLSPAPIKPNKANDFSYDGIQLRRGLRPWPTYILCKTLRSNILKAAILAFTRALARQVAEDGIRVNCVAPGPVWTPLQTSGGQPDKKIPAFGAETPMKRPGQPVEMAPLYVLLASQESSYVTGEVYGATGGLEIS